MIHSARREQAADVTALWWRQVPAIGPGGGDEKARPGFLPGGLGTLHHLGRRTLRVRSLGFPSLPDARHI